MLEIKVESLLKYLAFNFTISSTPGWVFTSILFVLLNEIVSKFPVELIDTNFVIESFTNESITLLGVNSLQKYSPVKLLYSNR